MTRKMGCKICREKVYSGQLLPLLATDVHNHLRLRQCDDCRALWLYAERYYQVIAESEAKRLFVDDWKMAGKS
jgi:hypothetical protein